MSEYSKNVSITCSAHTGALFRDGVMQTFPRVTIATITPQDNNDVYKCQRKIGGQVLFEVSITLKVLLAPTTTTITTTTQTTKQQQQHQQQQQQQQHQQQQHTTNTNNTNTNNNSYNTNTSTTTTPTTTTITPNIVLMTTPDNHDKHHICLFLCLLLLSPRQTPQTTTNSDFPQF